MYQRRLSSIEHDICLKIGKNIRQAREEMGITLREAAKHLNFPVSKLSEIENGKKIPNALILIRMAHYYEVSTSFFYTGDEGDVGRELYFKIARIAAPLRVKLNQCLSDSITQLCTGAIPAQAEMDSLINAVSDFVAQSHRMIQKNQNDAWQEMKGGTNFSIALKQLEHQLAIAKNAVLQQKRAIKQIKEKTQTEQLDLFND